MPVYSGACLRAPGLPLLDEPSATHRLLSILCALVLVRSAKRGFRSGCPTIDRDAAKAHFRGGSSALHRERLGGCADRVPDRGAALMSSAALDYNVARCFRSPRALGRSQGELRELLAGLARRSHRRGSARARRDLETPTWTSCAARDVRVSETRSHPAPARTGLVAGGALLFTAIGAGLVGHVGVDLGWQSKRLLQPARSRCPRHAGHVGFAAFRRGRRAGDRRRGAVGRWAARTEGEAPPPPADVARR